MPDPNILILGGTSEAMSLAREVAKAKLTATVSLAGRVDRPAAQPLPHRIGGFGGPGGLAAYITDQKITHVIDATHPFAAQMSTNVIEACNATGTPICALTRPAWTQAAGDRWHSVPSIPAAAAALDGDAQCIMLAIGRMHLSDFSGHPQHTYVLRLVDPPKDPLPLPKTEVIVARGPFTTHDDLALMRRYQVDLVVSKNAGGTGAYAKVEAARELGLPVIMVERPVIPPRPEHYHVEDVLAWINHAGTDRGV